TDSVQILQDAFTAVAALSPSGRAVLTQALGCDPLPIDAMPLGEVRDRSHRRKLRDAMAAATCDDAFLAAVATRRFDELSPAATLLSDGDVGDHQCDARLLSLLVRAGIRRWSALLDLHVGQVQGW